LDFDGIEDDLRPYSRRRRECVRRSTELRLSAIDVVIRALRIRVLLLRLVITVARLVALIAFSLSGAWVFAACLALLLIVSVWRTTVVYRHLARG